MIVGTNPVPVYSDTSNVPSCNGIGRNMPVSALLTASRFSVAISKLKIFDTPV
jgi:hypothetical protein